MNEIIDRIEKHIWASAKTENRIGIHNGLSGIALFYKYIYQNSSEKEYQDKLISTISRIDGLINKNKVNSSLCTGLAGYGYLLTTLQAENAIDIGVDYIYSLDTVLAEELTTYSNNDEYDFLHGALGIAMYFIERYNRTKNAEVSDILVNFTKIFLSKIDKNIETIFISHEKRNTKCLYFGIAHGISGYLNFLMILKNCLNEKIANIDSYLNKIIGFMGKYQNIEKDLFYAYPSFINLENRSIQKAGLGWCQGDLCIGSSIYNVGYFLNDNNVFLKEGLSLINNTKKITLIDSRVKDYAICHGSSGIILQYHLMNKNNVDYTRQINRWCDILQEQTSNFYKFESFYNDKYINEINILNGTAGLGLTLLTINNIIDADWTTCLNLRSNYM